MATARSRGARAARRRKRRVAKVDHDLTAADWASLLAAWAGCAYCGTVAGDLQRDCVLPISRGGRYTLGNVVPACRRCNTSKCNAEVTTWMRRRRLDERTFLVRHQQIVADLANV
jgi:5-methylcytosine-specific restriction endonuclease McrA